MHHGGELVRVIATGAAAVALPAGVGLLIFYSEWRKAKLAERAKSPPPSEPPR